jgi:glycosyltransferase involved in cell wall biosynthesis
LRTKLIEAAAFGRPIVSTALGAEGLADLEMGIAEEADAFAAEAVRRAAGPSEREAAGRNRRVVERAYGLDAVAGDFLALMAPGVPGAPAGSPS